MKERIGRRHWLLLIAAVVSFAGVLLARCRLTPRATGREQITVLRAELEQLRDCDELRVRTEAETLARRRSSGTSVPALPGWHPVDHERSRWAVDAPANWTEIVAALRAIEKAPLQRLQIRTRGSLTQREIASVEAVLMRPAATPPRREAGGAASAARMETKPTDAGGASLATRAGSRPEPLSPNQP